MALTADQGNLVIRIARVDFSISALEIPATVVNGTTAVLQAFDVPKGVVVVGGDVVVTTALTVNGDGTALLEIGDDLDDDRYSATAYNLEAAARTALQLTGFEYPAVNTIDFFVTTAVGTGTGAVTGVLAGYVLLKYTLRSGRSTDFVRSFRAI